MNKDYIVQIAQEAQAKEKGRGWWELHEEDLERLVAIVSAELGMSHYQHGYNRGLEAGVKSEREACAQLCEAVPIKGKRVEIRDSCVRAIRARSNKINP